MTAHRPPAAIRPHVACAGVTLIELMIVMTIVAIIAGIGFPSFQQLLASQRVRTAASAIHDSLIIARSEALKRNADAAFQTADLASGWTIRVDGQDVHAQAALNGLTFDPSAPAIAYGSTGRLTQGVNVGITVSGTGTPVTRCVRLDTTGRPRVTDGACS